MLREAVVAEDRYGDYLVEAFSTAEARLSERQVLRYAEDDCVVEVGSFGIEAAYASSANACVDAGEDIEYDTLTTQILEVDLAEVRLRSPEVRSGSAYGRHFTREVYGEIFFESDCCHCLLHCFCLLVRRVGGVSLFALITIRPPAMFTRACDYSARSQPSFRRRTRLKRLRLMQ